MTPNSERRAAVMGKQMTEMLKGTLEGIVLAHLAVQPAYGYEITAQLRKQGFTDIVRTNSGLATSSSFEMCPVK